MKRRQPELASKLVSDVHGVKTMNNRETNRLPATQRESFTELLGQLASNSATMVHDEIELVIQRIREKVRSVRLGGLIFVTGALTIFAAFIFFCAALFFKLTYYMTPFIAALVISGGLAFIGIVIVFIGYRQL
ncbi:MAG: phage holin family protein [Desulfamplus sp.]|nr:phage holin family protein [Desulfamplus sp.]